MRKTSNYIVALLLIVLGCFADDLCAQSFIDTACEGETGAVYSVVASPGSIYHWTIEDGTVSNYSADSSAITVTWGNKPGIKKLTVVQTSAYGCRGNEVEAFVLILPKGKVDIIGPEQVCKGERATLQAMGGADSYLWSNGSTGDKVTVLAEKDTSFSVTGYFGQCGTSVSLYDLQVRYRPEANFDFTPKEPVFNEPVHFEYTGTNNVDKWRWEFEEGGNTTGQSILDAPQYSFSSPGIKKIILSVGNDFGCTDTITKYIVIEAGINVFIPSAFTPNQDGLNSVFIPTYENVVSAKLLIYNRWGETIFATDRMDEGWDGTFKGQPVTDGVFMYLVQVVGKDNNKYVFDGSITLLR